MHMTAQKIRLEEMRPDEVQQRWAQAPIAFVPIGCVEYHGPHLPLGVDGMTAHAVCSHAAMRIGGVVHPTSYLANGCLDLPYTITYPPSVVEGWARAVTTELHRRGAELVVLLTGHGPLDLIHLLKRVAAELDRPGARVYGLCYLELNAARLTAPELGEPTVIDHASTIETSWMMAHHAELVDLDQLPDDAEAKTLGVYGKNPRFTASADIGIQQRNACADLLAARCSDMLAGIWQDDMDDLRAFVDMVWPEPLLLEREVVRGTDKLIIHNPGRASRYLTSLTNVMVNGSVVDLAGATIVNTSPGEFGDVFVVSELSCENGIYVRRGQSLELTLPGLRGKPSESPLYLEIELAGVRRQTLTLAK
jgi:creatinine amidohydrolase